MSGDLDGTVIAVSSDNAHRFGKVPRRSVRLVTDHGIEGDAHAGRFMKHRYLTKRAPKLPNNRQVHLIQSELFGDLKLLGFEVRPGELGENITTRGINLLELPFGSLLHLGNSAIVELTGLRTPCGYLDKFQKGLKRTMIVRTHAGVGFRSGVLGIVRESGEVTCGDCIKAERPSRPWKPLPAL